MKPLSALRIPCLRHLRRNLGPSLSVAGAALLVVQAFLPTIATGQDDPYYIERQRVRTVIAREDVSGGGTFFYVIFRQPTPTEAAGANWTIENNVIVRGEMGYEGISRVILAPTTEYNIYALYADSLMFGSQRFTTPRAGETFSIPKMGFFDLVDTDTDNDGLSDIREFVIGTNENDPDSDDDEINDAAEVQQGMDPLSGVVAATGIIATAPVPGEAFDIIANNNIAVVAAKEAGVSIFNVEASRTPTRIGQVDTPGSAYLVAMFGTNVAVADLAGGLSIIDISDPPNARISRTLTFGSNVTAVATYGSIAYAGCENGLIVSVDMISGTEIARYQGLNGRIWNMVVGGDYLYVLRSGQLSVFLVEDGDLAFVRHVTASGSVGAGQRPLRLFLGDKQLITTFTSGINVFSLSNPDTPVLLKSHPTAQQGWKQIALAGNGRAVATVSPNSTNDGAHNVSMYAIGENGATLEFLAEFETPGLASSVTIYNGRAFVADSSSGLQVINYLAFDRFGIAPTISLETNAVEGAFEEGKLMDVRALATDDRQVRNVQFYVNDQITNTDGNFPFGMRLLTPLISGGVTSFKLHAVATDTGGNMTTSSPVMITLVPDITPPRIKAVTPRSASYLGEVDTVVAVMSEPINPATLTAQSFNVVFAGEDDLFGTSDDAPTPGTLSFDPNTNRARLAFGSNLANGIYEVRINAPLADLAGNVVAVPYIGNFKVLGFTDSDGDGLPDFWEIEHGSNPNNPDSDKDGIPDGEEDADNDGLIAIGEYLLDRDPAKSDTNGDGTKDGAYDDDFDGLNDGLEFKNGTDPFKVDTDGDGISDSDEVREGTNPLSPNSLLKSLVASEVASMLNAIQVPPGEFENVFTVASNPASYLNGIPIVPDEEVVFSVATPPASYLNGVMTPAEAGPTIVISPEISYEGQ